MHLSLTIWECSDEIIVQSEFDTWEESFGVWLQAIALDLFRCFYCGSLQEANDALDYSEDEWPSSHMSDRQVMIRQSAPKDAYYYKVDGRLQ